jgi:osmoprotectant transport system substrate-binding protein
MRSLRLKSLSLFVLLSILLLSACSSGSSGSVPPTGNGTNSPGTAASSGSKGPLTVGGKLDTEAQLLTDMYTQLLQNAGYKVNEKLALGNSIIVSQAIESGAIDLYPEFTATGLNKLGIPSTYDPQKDYQMVKDGYKKNYQITWLDMAPLNDGYALCTTKDQSAKLGITNISQLAPQVAQLTLASPSDGVDFVDGLKPVYGFDTKSFKGLQKVDYSIAFQSVASGSAQLTVCYTTDGSVATKNFIFLKDDKNGFPQFHPAPIVRDEVLNKYPDIATILNPLAPKLTTAVSIQLQQQVADKKASGASITDAVKQVARQFLTEQGMLK